MGRAIHEIKFDVVWLYHEEYLSIMAPTLRQFRTFLAVAQTGHVTRAARRLDLTQPAVTHQIRQLEHAIGAPLLRRDGRRIALTAEGETLLAEITPVFGALEAMMARVQRRTAAAELAGVVRVATLQSYNESLVVGAATLLMRRHPNIRLVSREMAADAIASAVRDGDADLGLTFQLRRSAGLRTRVLAHEHLVAVIGAGAPVPEGDPVGLAALAGRPLALMPREFALRALVEDLAANEGVAVRAAFESSNLSALIAFARANGGVAIIPLLVAHGWGDVTVRRLGPDGIRSVSLVTSPIAETPVVAAAVAAIEETAAAWPRAGTTRPSPAQ